MREAYGMRSQRVRTMLLCALLGVICVVLPGCVTPTMTGPLLVPSGPPQNSDTQADPNDGLTEAINDFGLELVSAASANDNDNTIVSPVSVHAALSMTANGADGETAGQMREVLRTDAMTTMDANNQWASLLTGLGSRGTSQRLEIANSLWASDDVAFMKPFIDADRDYFGAQVSTLDFERDDVASAINGWVSKNTREMITRIVDDVPDDVGLYLANAAYFEGDWVTPFDHERTLEQPFTRPDGSMRDVEMMHMTEQMPYYENTVLKATRLMYKGNDSAFYVLLPKPGVSLDAALASTQAAEFAEMRAAMTSGAMTEVILGLPKLDADFSSRLKEPLSAMGMPRAFDEREAQFSDIADVLGPLYIGDVYHKAKIRVDEKGTVAAAATAVEMAVLSAAPTVERAMVVCDRPYAFAIVDERSGAMLFLGTINDPGE